MIIDHTNRRVLDVLESREKEHVALALRERFEDGQLAEVREVTCDMWGPFAEAARAVFGESVRVTVDRFHVMKNFQDRLTQARREIQRRLPADEAGELKGTRWLWLKNEEHLTPEERRMLAGLSRRFPRLGRLRRQREGLRAIFEDGRLKTPAGGMKRLRRWMAQARRMGLEALDRFCQTLENWLEPIANYFVSRSSNGPTEGFNNALRAILRRAFGMRSFENFRTRVLDALGKPRPQESP